MEYGGGSTSKAMGVADDIRQMAGQASTSEEDVEWRTAAATLRRSGDDDDDPSALHPSHAGQDNGGGGVIDGQGDQIRGA